jgi:hypothetical protein
MGTSQKNIASAIHQQLLNKARQTGRPFYELLQYYSMERFLYRLSKSPHANKFVLKGVLMLAVWNAPLLRPTRDIDLLGKFKKDIVTVAEIIRDICIQDVEPDGIVLDITSVRGEQVVEGADYEGVRVHFRGTLGPSRINMQLDISFGDIVIPSDTPVDYPTILDMPHPRLRGYTRESAIAEKFQTMVKLDILNTRLKDFYDIWLISRQFSFDGQTLAKAVGKTFSKRGTKVVARPIAFTKAFFEDQDKQQQWRGFIRKARIVNAPSELDKVIDAVAGFLGPVAESIIENRPFYYKWTPPGPWLES